MTPGELFSVSVAKWAKGAKDELGAVARIAIQDTAEIVDEMTPVDTGFLVGNWQPSLDAPVLETDPSGYGTGYAASKVGLVISEMKAGDTFYYVNNAVYARRINYGFVGEDSLGRHYNQAGRHMVEYALARWPTVVAGAVAKLGAGK